MSEIHKHMVVMDPGRVTEIKTKGFARVLSAGFQAGQLFVWEQHPSDVALLPIWVKPVFTGQEFDAGGWKFVGTASENGLVWHVYWTDNQRVALR